MLLDKKRVGYVTKVGAVILVFVFVLSFVPFIAQLGTPTQDTQNQQNQDTNATMMAALKQAVVSNPKNASAWVLLGNAYSDQQKYKEAIESYSKALAINPKDATARVDMAVSYFGDGQVETATVEIKKALEVSPKLAPAHFNLALFLTKQGKVEEAIASYETYLKLDPKGDRAKDAKDQIALLKGADSGASAAFGEADAAGKGTAGANQAGGAETLEDLIKQEDQAPEEDTNTGGSFISIGDD